MTTSGGVFVIGYAIMTEDRVAGALFLVAYSTFMVVRAYRRPITLGIFTALLPGGMAFLTFSIQGSLLDAGNSDLRSMGFMLGIVPGIIIGLAHRVYQENGRVWAKKGFLYLLIWGVS